MTGLQSLLCRRAEEQAGASATEAALRAKLRGGFRQSGGGLGLGAAPHRKTDAGARRSTGAAKAHIYPSGHEDEECVGGALDTTGVIAAVVSVVFNRPDYLKRHAASLLAVHGSDLTYR